MKKLFFLGLGLFHLNNVQGFWPFTSSSTQKSFAQTPELSSAQNDTALKEVNRLINENESLKEENNKLEVDIIVNSLRHSEEIKQKDQEIAQLKKQVAYFATAYITLCKTYKKYSTASTIKAAFKILKNSLLNLDSEPEITADIDAATKDFNTIIKDDLQRLRQKEIKKNLITMLTQENPKSSDK